MVNCLKIEQKSLQFFNEIHGERVVFRAKGRELAGSKKNCYLSFLFCIDPVRRNVFVQ